MEEVVERARRKEKKRKKEKDIKKKNKDGRALECRAKGTGNGTEHHITYLRLHTEYCGPENRRCWGRQDTYGRRGANEL